MNSRQRKKKIKKSLFHDYEIKGRKVYSYAVACGDNIIIGFTSKPKQKGCCAFPEKYIREEIRLYGRKAAYDLIVLFK